MILALVKSARFWGILGALAGGATLVTWGYNQVYSAGYQAAELKYRNEQLAAIEDAVGAARARWEKSAQAAEAEVKIETEIVERIRIVEREVPRVVERSVPADCRDLGLDVLRVFNDAIAAGDRNEGSGSASPAELDR